MGKPLSNDLRLRLIRNVEGGMSARAAGRKLDIAPSTATGIVQHWRETGSHEALAMGGHKPLALEAEKDFVERLVDAHDDWSEQALAAHIAQERGVRVHPVTVGRLIRKMGWRFKKNAVRQRAQSRGCG